MRNVLSLRDLERFFVTNFNQEYKQNPKMTIKYL